MTYRNVDKAWQRILQWATLIATLLVGYAITLLPEDDARRSQLENMYMHGDIFAWTLALAAGVALVGELWMARPWYEPRWGDESLMGVVAWGHIICSGALAGYSLAALAGVLIDPGPNVNLGGPILGILLALYHAAYVKRRPRARAHIVPPEELRQ